MAEPDTEKAASTNTSRSLSIVASRDEDQMPSQTYVNVDNISYFRRQESEITTVGIIILGTLSVIGGLMALGAFLSQSGFAVGVAGAFIVGAFIYGTAKNWIDLPNNLDIGTVGGTLILSRKDADEVEDKFLERARDVLSFDSRVTSVFVESTYRYHFVPDNIVSIRHVGGLTFTMIFGLAGYVVCALFGFEIGALVGLAVFVGGCFGFGPQTGINTLDLGSSIDDEKGVEDGPTVEPEEAGPIHINLGVVLGTPLLLHSLFSWHLAGLVGSAVVVGAGFIVPGLPVSDKIEIQLQGGDTKLFYLSPKDTVDFLDTFDERATSAP